MEIFYPVVKGVATIKCPNPLPTRGNRFPAMGKRQPITKVLAENVRALMSAPQNRHLDSDRKLGRLAGVNHKTINNILNARHNVTLTNVEKIARAFRVEVVALFCPATDRGFLTICQVYSGADSRGREFLAATAETVRRTSAPTTRPVTQSGETEH